TVQLEFRNSAAGLCFGYAQRIVGSVHWRARVRQVCFGSQTVNDEGRTIGRAIADDHNRFEELMQKTNSSRKNYDAGNLGQAFASRRRRPRGLSVSPFRCEQYRINGGHVDAWPTHAGYT